MSSRTRPRRSGNIPLDIRMRRLARRASADLRPSAAVTTPQADLRPPSDDIGAERDLIVARIAELRRELAEQERHLQAIDLLLAADPAAKLHDGRKTASPLRAADVLDAEYTVVR